MRPIKFEEGPETSWMFVDLIKYIYNPLVDQKKVSSNADLANMFLYMK